MLGDVRYREFGLPVTVYNSLTLADMEIISSVYGFYDSLHIVRYFAEFTNVNIVLPRRPPGTLAAKSSFYAFEEQSSAHKTLFADLKIITEGLSGNIFVDVAGDGKKKPAGSDAEKAQRANIAELKKKIFDDKTLFSGAKYISAGGGAAADVGLRDVLEAVDSRIVTSIPSADFELVLSYGIAAFSCYATAKPGGEDRSVTGAVFAPKANYFYQSEAEYIFNGSITAEDNLNTVRKLIIEVRELLNNIAAFKADGVNACVNAIRSIPLPLGLSFVLGELARSQFAEAETAMDISRIRNGYKTAFLKTGETWRCVPSRSFADPKTDDDDGFGYGDYMFILFVTKANTDGDFDRAADDFVGRAGDLIEWNMVNYTEKVNAKEAAMSAALLGAGRFRLANAATGINISARAEIRMLFLSSPFAQKETKGRFAGALPVTSAGQRGY